VQTKANGGFFKSAMDKFSSTFGYNNKNDDDEAEKKKAAVN
jgi:hypothetical protein